MNYKEFEKKAKKDELKPVSLFLGEEDYLIDKTLKNIKKLYIDESFEPLNYMVLSGKDVDFDKILSTCETLPFMSEKKLVIVKDFPLFRSKSEIDRESKQWSSPKSKKLLMDYLEELDGYLCLIFVEKVDTIRKNNALYKTIGQVGQVVEFKKLKGRDLDNWIENKFKENNIKISSANINYFTQQSSYFTSKMEKTLYDLENEIIKISNYLSSGDEVKREDINKLMPKPLEMNIFNLLDSISRKDGDNAIRLFNEMYMSNEPALFILHMIVRQLRNMLYIKSLKTAGYNDRDTQSKVKMSPYEYKKVSGQSRNFATLQLERALLHCLETDKSIKTSPIDDRLALEILITNLCSNI